MEAPAIAIVGSVDQNRADYDPPLRNVDKVVKAMEELGAELAKAGYRILVYSSSTDYIEADVVRGYANSKVANEKSIVIRYPRGAGVQSRFAEQGTQPALFDPRADTTPNWQVSFYESLKDASGVLIVGGVNSALITGVTARLLGIPIVALSTFGGSAENLWVLMRDLANVTEQEHQLMGRDTWESDSASRIVKSLTDQKQRIQDAAERKRQEALRERTVTKNRAVRMMGLFTLAVILLGAGLLSPMGMPWFAIVFFAVPLLAGAAGGVTRNVLDLFQNNVVPKSHDEPSSLALGAVGGFLSSILFIAAQWVTMPQATEMLQKGLVPAPLRVLMLFELVIGFTAGLTLDAVFTKLRATDVLDTSQLTRRK